MKYFILPFTVLAALLLTALVAIGPQEWVIKEGFVVKFSSKNPSGVFNDLKGEIRFSEEALSTSGFNVVIDARSIDTGVKLKNQHAMSDKWFDAEKYPEIRFVSKEISKTDKGFQVKGELDMHGVKKELLIPFTFERNGSEGNFFGTFEVNRNDFNIGKPGGKVPDVMQVEVSVPVFAK